MVAQRFAVIAGEDDEGVVALSGFVDGIDDPANGSVEVHDAGCILAWDLAFDFGWDLFHPFLGFSNG